MKFTENRIEMLENAVQDLKSAAEIIQSYLDKKDYHGAQAALYGVFQYLFSHLSWKKMKKSTKGK